MMRNLLISMMLFLAFWLVLAEKATLEAISIGVAVCMGIYLFNNKHKTEVPGSFWTFTGMYYMLIYLLTLIREIVAANIQVAGVVLRRKLDVTSDIIQFKTKLKSRLTRTILANSITLTPGTLTVLIEEDVLTIHCLQKEYIQDVLDSKFEKILLKIED